MSIIAEGFLYKVATLSYEDEIDQLLKKALTLFDIEQERNGEFYENIKLDQPFIDQFEPFIEEFKGYVDDVLFINERIYGKNESMAEIAANPDLFEEDNIVKNLLEQNVQKKNAKISCLCDFHSDQFGLCGTRLFIIINDREVTAFYSYYPRIYG